MSYGLRSITFVAELIHPPVKHEPRVLQKLHGDLFADSACSYRDFRLVPGGAQLSNAIVGVPGAPVSCANLMPDRVQIREEQTGVSLEAFEERVEALARRVLSNLPSAAFLAQQYLVRSVINAASTQDARVFVLQSMLGMDAALFSLFPGQPSLAGMRFTFPPVDQGAPIFNVRVESFAADNRSLFLENVGTFRQPVSAQNLDELGRGFAATYDFLREHLVEFVAQFDVEDTGA